MTPKEIKFCQEYLLDLNATQAAIRAGYSKRSARQIGADNMAKPYISAWIDEQRKAAAKRTELTQDRILQEYAKIAFSDIRKIFNEQNAVIDIKDIDDDTAASISSTESFEEYSRDGVLTGFTKKVKLWDKVRALDSISKVLGYNAAEKLEVENTGTLNIVSATDYKKLSSNEHDIED
jgi:phage terminase small subunit